MQELLASLHNLLPVWTVSRAAGLTSYLLLFVSVVTGMSAHDHFMKPKTKAGLNLIHQATGWFGLLFGMVHGLVLVFSTYESFSVWHVLIPFSAATHPILIGLGTLVLYVMILLIVTSDYRKSLGRKTWKTIHFLAYPAFVAAFFHSVLLGPDTQTPLMLFLYTSTAAAAALALICRLAIRPPERQAKKKKVTGMSVGAANPADRQ